MKNKYTGAIIGKRKTDYILGSSPVEKTILNESGNWKTYTPEHEKQAFKYFDTLSCVTFSATDTIEYLFNKAIRDGKILKSDIAWLKENGYFKNCLINFNERFTAILGGTTSKGAYQYKVGDAIRKYGLIPQDMFSSDVKNQEEYLDKTAITNEMYSLGEEFIKRFPINYEWVLNIKEGLKYSPLQVCVYYADGEGILCPTNRPQHAVVLINYTDDYGLIDDSYTHQFKKYCHEAIYSAMLYTVKFMNKEKARILKDKNSNSVGVFLPALTEDVLKSYALNMGIEIPKTADGLIDWERTINGEFEIA